MDKYTSTIRKKLKDKDLFKESLNPQRDSPIIDN